MFSSLSRQIHCPSLFAAFFLVALPGCWAQSPEALATAHRWTAAKFLGEVTPDPAQSYLLTYTQSGQVTKNAVRYTLRVFMPGPSRFAFSCHSNLILGSGP